MRRLVAIALIVFPLVASADHRARRQRLAAKLDAATAVALVFGSEEEDDSFRQNNDFLYLTGWNEPGAALLIAPAIDDRPYTEILFLPDRNESIERWTGNRVNASTPNARQVAGVDRVESLDALRDELVRVLRPRPTIFTDVSNDGHAEVALAWLRRANAFPRYTTYRDLAPMVGDLRLIKDASEIALLRKAANVTIAAHNAAAKALRPGVTENEIAALIEYEFRRGGCQGSAFPSIVGSGHNSTVLHYNENSGTMGDGDVVVMDVGAECNRYASDVTRTRPVNGRFTPRQREIYDIVLGAQRAAVAAFKPGASTLRGTGENSLHRVALEYINAHGKDRQGQTLGRYFIHGLGHYVGLEVHDSGSYETPIAPGTVFTIEPGIYIPEERIGVRIEDTYLVRDDGTLECLSCAAPK